MSEWPAVRLAEVTALIKRGRAPSYSEAGMLVVSQKCVRSGNVFDATFARRTDTSVKAIPEWALLRDGDVLVNSTGRGTLGRACFVRSLHEPMTADSHVSIVRANRARAVPAYLGTVLSHLSAEIERLQSGSTNQTELSPAALGSFRLPLPPLDEQRRIVAVMSAVDAQIAGMEAEERALQKFLNIRRMDLVNDVSVPQVRAQQAFEFSTGVRRTPDRANGPSMTQYLRSANVGYGALDLSDVQLMNYEAHEREKFGLQYGDVLVSEGSASAKAVGMPAMWRDELPGPVCFQMTLLRLRALEAVCIPEFAFQWCMWAYESGRFLDVAGGTSIKHISALRSSQMPVRLPSLDRQREIAHELASTTAALDGIRAELASLRIVRANLLSALLSQEIIVDAAVDKFAKAA